MLALRRENLGLAASGVNQHPQDHEARHARRLLSGEFGARGLERPQLGRGKEAPDLPALVGPDFDGIRDRESARAGK
jgi:hypothetical protein